MFKQLHIKNETMKIHTRLQNKYVTSDFDDFIFTVKLTQMPPSCLVFNRALGITDRCSRILEHEQAYVALDDQKYESKRGHREV